MIRFGTENSPDLYYALGNLLAVNTVKSDWPCVRTFRAIETGHPQAELVRKFAEEVAKSSTLSNS